MQPWRLRYPRRYFMKFGWKTISGALLTAFGYVSQPDVMALLPTKWAAWVMAIGGVLGAIGIRHAVAKVKP